jgi:bacterioferritin
MTTNKQHAMTREKLADALNEDLSREYRAIISYVNYSQVLKGAAYMNIADELAGHAKEVLDHAFTDFRITWTIWDGCRRSRLNQ